MDMLKRRASALLLLLALLLTGCASSSPPPAATSAPSPAATAAPSASPTAEPVLTPTPEPTPTPCPHLRWAEGRCLYCGEACAHPAHDMDSRLCKTCGELVPHSFEELVCTRCGAQPLFAHERIPRRLFRPCERAGTVEMFSYTVSDPRLGAEAAYEKQAAVYLPYGYDPGERYDLLILLHGLGGSEKYWLVDFQEYQTGGGDFVFTRHLLDNMMDEGLCRRMIVVAPTFYRSGTVSAETLNEFCGSDEEWLYDYPLDWDPRQFTYELHEFLMPALAAHYATWAADGTPEAIAEAREHFAYAGLSMGAMFTYISILPRCLDEFAWFASFSGSDGDMDWLAGRLNSETLRVWPIRFFYNSIGSYDSFLLKHQTQYEQLIEACGGLTDGENAVFHEFKGLPHTYAAWSLGLYDFLPLIFPLPSAD